MLNIIGVMSWFEDGKLHRVDGPAVVYPSGLKKWYRHGKLHREDGPAITSKRGNRYYLNGTQVDPLVLFVNGLTPNEHHDNDS